MALSKPLANTDLDETDLNIIKYLSIDSKISFADLGKATHLTAPAVHARVKKMEKLGVIKNYSIVLDFDKIGLPVIAFVKVQTGKVRCRDVAKKITSFEEVEDCYSVAGEDDMILKTRTATPLDLQNLLDKLKTQGLIEKSVSVLVMETHFERPRI